MGGHDQVPVVDPGERLRLALSAVVEVQLVEQVRSFAVSEADDAGHVDAAGASAADRHHRTGADRRPGASLRRPQSLPGLVFEAEVGTQVRRGGFAADHTSAFHSATACSSRSRARRAGTCTDQPWRCSSLPTPSMV